MTKHCLKPDWEAGLGISKLPLELYWVPQIDGETDAIRVDL